MDKAGLEWLVAWLDLAIRVFTVCAAISGVFYMVYSRQLQRITRQELGAEKERAASVQLEMQSGIASANERAEDARARQRELEVQAAEARLEQELLKSQNLELQSQVEKERIGRLKIEERLAWRTLSVDQRKRMEASLRRFPADFEIRVFQEPEALQLLNAIVEILHSSGWTQRPVAAALEVSTRYGAAGITLVAGIQVRTDPSQPNLIEPAKALAAALVSEGIEARAAVVEQQTYPERIRIAIGKKP